jgi:hypothetical protein
MLKECTIALASLLQVLTWDAHCHRVGRIARKKHLVRIAHLARCHTLHGDVTPEMRPRDGIALDIERLYIPAGMLGWAPPWCLYHHFQHRHHLPRSPLTHESLSGLHPSLPIG